MWRVMTQMQIRLLERTVRCFAFLHYAAFTSMITMCHFETQAEEHGQFQNAQRMISFDPIHQNTSAGRHGERD